MYWKIEKTVDNDSSESFMDVVRALYYQCYSNNLLQLLEFDKFVRYMKSNRY